MVVIDTSVWLSSVLPTDVHFRQTQPFLERVSAGQMHLEVPAHFPAEVAGVLSRIGEPEQFINDTIDLLASGNYVTIHPISVRLGLLAAGIARRARIRGSDAVFLALATSLGVPLLTWDKQQRERGALFCRTMTPTEAIAIEPD